MRHLYKRSQLQHRFGASSYTGGKIPDFLGHQLVASFIDRWNVRIKQTIFAFYSIKIRFIMAEIAGSQLPRYMAHYLVATYVQLECAHIVDQPCFLQHQNPTCKGSDSLQLVPTLYGHQLEASPIAKWDVLIKKTNFAFYSIKIRLVMPEIAYSQLPHYMGHQLVATYVWFFVVSFFSQYNHRVQFQKSS